MRLFKIKFDPDKIKFRTEVEIDFVTVLVGPNNSGKSQVLRDIDNWCFNHTDNLRIVKDLDLDLPTNPTSIEKLYEEFRIAIPLGEISNSNVMFTRPPYTPINRTYSECDDNNMYSNYLLCSYQLFHLMLIPIFGFGLLKAITPWSIA